MIRLENVLKKFLQDVRKTSWRHLENVLKTYDQDNFVGLDQMSWRRLLKTYELGNYIRLDQDVSWRRRQKTSSRRLHQDECLLGRFFTILQKKILNAVGGRSSFFVIKPSLLGKTFPKIKDSQFSKISCCLIIFVSRLTK